MKSSEHSRGEKLVHIFALTPAVLLLNDLGTRAREETKMKTASEMTSWKNRRLGFALAILVVLVNSAAAQERYRVEDLGTLGGTFAVSFGLNDRGWVDGQANLPGDAMSHAFLWRRGVMTDLGTLGGPNSAASALNERGQIVGGAETPMQDPNQENDCFFGTTFQCLPFILRHGKMAALPTLGGTNGFANWINNRGQVIGYAENKMADATCSPGGGQVLQIEPVQWEEGEIHQLPTFVGDPDGVALAINDEGQTVGTSGNCFTSSTGIQVHAVLWQECGAVIDLGNLGGTQSNIAEGINNHTQVVGYSGRSDGTINAFLWQEGTITDLGTVAGDMNSYGYAINDNGQVVGTSVNASGNPRAFLRHHDMLTDLNTLIPADSPLFLLDAYNINERGDIAGDALQIATGEVHAYLARRCEADDSEDEGCRDRAAVPSEALGQSNGNKRVIVPENVRTLVRERLARYSLSRPLGKE
jgi:probable HAF family extracellular repeat protein